MANSWREALAAMRTRCRGYRGATRRQRMLFSWRAPLSRASLGSLLPSVSCLTVSAYDLELISSQPYVVDIGTQRGKEPVRL